MVGQAIEQGGYHLGVAKDSGPVAEADLCGDHDFGALVKFAEHVEPRIPICFIRRSTVQRASSKPLAFEVMPHLTDRDDRLVRAMKRHCVSCVRW